MTTATKQPNITQDMKDTAKAVFMAMAWVQTVRPIVEGYKKRILDEMKPTVSEKYAVDFKLGFKVITDIKDTYLMNDADFQTYLKRCNEERIKARLHVDNEEFCPLLVAESMQRDAEALFIEAMFPITHIKKEDLLYTNNCVQNLQKLIDLSLRLVAPYVKNK